MTDLIGRTLGQYRIVEQIGAGGMATIYKAYQPSLDRYVALKVLAPVHAEEPGFNERFQREARAVANLNHPNILPVFDFGQEEGYSFIAMRYVEGARTLKEVMEAPLSLGELVDLIAQIAGALEYAHGRGVVHRDVKPSNVLMDGDWALLADFGIAKMTEASVKLTGTGVGIGTPAYMSPEQGQGIAVDHRTDIYSLGVILFEMLTGQIPHDAETPFGIVIKRITEPLPPPRTINPEIPEPVERVILKALATAPDDRFSSAGELAQALALASAPAPALPAAEPVLAGPPTAPDAPAVGETTIVVEGPAAARKRRTPPWLWGLVGAVILILALGVWSLTSGESEQEPAVALATETPTPTAAVTPEVSATLSPASTSPPPTATSAPTATSTPPTATLAPTATSAPPTVTPTTTVPPPPTATPPPTMPPTATEAPPPTPTLTREPVVAYRPVPLGAAANADSDFLSPPVGAISFSGVPFELSGREFKSQASPAPNNGYPTSALLSAKVPQAYRVHLLLTTGNGYNQFDGSVIGRVVAYCDGSAVTVTDLVLGRDVREWHAADNVVSSASRPRQVWSGAIRNFPDLSGYYDMLSLDLPDTCQSGRLTAVEIVDSSATGVNSLDPAFNLIGVSVEYHR